MKDIISIFHFRRAQLPIRLCFAMIINKVQGQTSPYVGVYLPQHVFSHGQLYVILLCGTSMSTIKVLIKYVTPICATINRFSTKNVVYKEAFIP